MKTKSLLIRIRWYCILAVGACLGASAVCAADTNAPVEAPPPMSPEDMFEGGTNTYNNWVEVGGGGFLTSGSAAQSEQNHQSWDGPFGGIQDFHYGGTVATNTTLTMDGHAVFAQDDYKAIIDLERQNVGFLRFNYDEFRTWENGNGGYYPPAGTFYPWSGDALTLDNGTISIAAGLRLQNSPNVPQVTFKYTHTFQNGDEPSTSWGFAQPDPNNPNTVRALTPSFYSIDEHQDIYQLDAAQHIKATDVGVGLRYETGDMNDSLNSSQWPGQPFYQSIANQSSVSYDMYNAHAYSETWLKDNLMMSIAYSYSQLNNDFTGGYSYSPDLGAGNGFGYNNLNGSSWEQDHVVNVNLYTKLMNDLSLVPSLRVEKQDADVTGNEIETFQGSTASPGENGNQEDLEVSERLDLNYTGITNWVLYARGEWTEGSGNLNEYGGLIPINGITEFQPVQSQINDNRLFQKYSLGARWYPLYRVAVDVGGYYEIHDYDYNFPLDSTTNNSAMRYPGYLVMQNFETYDGNARLTLRPWQNVSFVGRYEYQLSTIHTAPDAISGLGDAESSRMITHIIGANATWTPWSRISLNAGFDYVFSETKTPASGYTQAILNAQNNYWTVNFSTDFVVDDKTDLSVSYYYYRADDYNNYALEGVPYGAGSQEHAVTAQIVRRLTQNLRLTLRSGYYHYTDDTSGGNNNFDTYLIMASMQYRF